MIRKRINGKLAHLFTTRTDRQKNQHTGSDCFSEFIVKKVINNRKNTLLFKPTTYCFIWKQWKNVTEMYLPISVHISDDPSYSGHAHGKNIGSITAYGSGNKKHAVFSIAVGRPISWSLKIMLFYLLSFSITYIIRLP